MITYKPYSKGTLVLLDGKQVGIIQQVAKGFQYWPKRAKNGGEFFPTLQACKNSLEHEEEAK